MEADPVIDAIADGAYDGRLVDIAVAVRRRLTVGPTTSRWRITYDDQVFTEEDLTLAEARTVEAQTGTTWLALNPTRSATDCVAIVAACLHHRDGIPFADADALVSAWGVLSAVSSIDAYEADVDAPVPE